MSDLTPEDIDRYALGGGDAIDRALDLLWCHAVDAATSDDLKLPDGSLDEEALLRYKANAIKKTREKITKASP
jgi:hypothetical protein